MRNLKKKKKKKSNWRIGWMMDGVGIKLTI